MIDTTVLDSSDWQQVGQSIRERRVQLQLTLVELAEQVGLSQPFLSQIENGRAHPSMTSLYRIAHALGTTPQALFAGKAGALAEPTLVRAGERVAVPVVVPAEGDAGESNCRLLLPGDAPFHVLEFDGLPGAFLDYWEHDGFEAVYVIDGDLDIDVAGAVTSLGVGDFLSYPARLPHRLRSTSGGRVRLLMIETTTEASQHRPGSGHRGEGTAT